MNGFEIIDDQTSIVEQPKVEITKPGQENQQVAQRTKLDVVSEGLTADFFHKKYLALFAR